jgi:ABC-2 type transport system permease protein
MIGTFMHTLIHRFKIIFPTKRSYVLLLLMICLPMLLSHIITSDNERPNKIPIAIADLDKTAYSTAVIERIKEKTSLLVIEHSTKKAAFNEVKQENVEVAYIIEQGFMEQLISGNNENLLTVIRAQAAISIGLVNEIMASEVNRLSTNVASADYVITNFKQRDLSIPDNIWQEAWQYTDDQWEPVPLLTMEYFELGAYTTQDFNEMATRKAVTKLILILGISVTIFMVFIFFTNQSFIQEKNNGTLVRLTFSKLKPLTYLFMNAFAVSVIALTLFLPTAFYLLFAYELPILLFSKLLISCFALFISFVSISLLFSTVFKSVIMYHLSMVLFAISFTLFGGTFINVSDLTERLAIIANFTPQHWFFSIVRGLLEGQAINFIPTLALSSICLLFFIFTFILMEVKHD